MDVGDQTVMICRRLLSFKLYFAHLCSIFRVCENWIALFGGELDEQIVVWFLCVCLFLL